MKLIRVFSLFGMAIVPHLAFAETTPPAGLGQTKAIYDYCAQIDPAEAETFGRMWRYSAGPNARLTPGADFQGKYNSTMSELKALPTTTTLSGCHASALQWRRSRR
jgi:hypothetical protein